MGLGDLCRCCSDKCRYLAVIPDLMEPSRVMWQVGAGFEQVCGPAVANQMGLVGL